MARTNGNDPGPGDEPRDDGLRTGESPGEPAPLGPEPASEAVRVIRDALFLPRPPSGIPAALVHDEELRDLLNDIADLREFLLALSDGDLSRQLKVKGFFAGTLKRLQAHLMHITWQTQMVAAGDFSQRLDFMGEFSAAFNAMTVQLKLTMEKLKESEERYRHLSCIDQLTGLDNRRRFFELAGTEFNRAERYARSVSLLMVDLDHFKQVNDRYGHPCGDAVLREVARRLKAQLRDVDRLCRFGGEEFIGMLPDVGLEQAALAAERLRQSLEQDPLRIGEESIPMTASFGVSVFLGSGTSGQVSEEALEQAIAAADRALYCAKRNGRNQVWSGEDGGDDIEEASAQ